MISVVKSFGLRTMNARPWGSHETMHDMGCDGSVSGDSLQSISYNFSGKGCVTPPVFLRTKPIVSGTLA